MKTTKINPETPCFKNEAEEAEWWDKQPDQFLAVMQKAEAEVRLKRGGNTPVLSIRLDPNDVEIAKQQAAKRGLKYQTYLKLIIHDALEKETSRLKRQVAKG